MGLRGCETMLNMRFRRVRSPARIIAAAAMVAMLVFLLLPYDNPIRLACRFNASRLRIYLQSSSTRDSWLRRPPEYPINITEDVGVIIKIGYGTRHRLPAALKALETGFGSRDIAVIADFSPGDETRYTYHGDDVQVYDILAGMLQNKSTKWMESTPRFQKYSKMTAAIAEGDSMVAEEIGKSAGWELDAVKFIPGLKLAFDLMPKKKWYIILDDDTYLVRPSMRLLLQHLDPDMPQYIGNPVGDFKTRFAHGGSSILLSRPALQKLFVQNPKVVYAGYLEGLTETWGDKLVAANLIKIGIYLEERYERFFNGQKPLTTRIRSDRFCLPVVAFHSLADPQRMREVGDFFSSIDDPVLWSDLWKLFHAPDLDDMLNKPIRNHEDHVGRTDESSTTFKNVDDAKSCLKKCASHSSCLAWTWDAGRRSCNISPWMIVGQESQAGSSGVSARRALKLLDNCPGRRK